MLGKVKFFVEFEKGILNGVADYIHPSAFYLMQQFNNKSVSFPELANLFEDITKSSPTLFYIIPREDSADFDKLLLKLYETEAAKQQIRFMYIKLFDGSVKPEKVGLHYHSILELSLHSVNVGVSRFSTGGNYRHLLTFTSADRASET